MDEIRESKCCGNLHADPLNKDKTRILQFIAPLDVFEKVVAFLLSTRHNGEAEQDAHTSGEDMLRYIAGIDRDCLLRSFQPSSICPLATQNAIDGAVALAKWFRNTRDLSLNAPAEVQAFREARLKLVQPRPAVTVQNAFEFLANCCLNSLHPLSFMKVAARDKGYIVRFAQDPYRSIAEVKTKSLSSCSSASWDL